jgi:hypothetical protein
MVMIQSLLKAMFQVGKEAKNLGDSDLNCDMTLDGGYMIIP